MFYLLYTYLSLIEIGVGVFQAIEEKMMMSKYGDIWIRSHNDKLVLGIPIYNCTFKR